MIARPAGAWGVRATAALRARRNRSGSDSDSEITKLILQNQARARFTFKPANPTRNLFWPCRAGRSAVKRSTVSDLTSVSSFPTPSPLNYSITHSCRPPGTVSSQPSDWILDIAETVSVLAEVTEAGLLQLRGLSLSLSDFTTLSTLSSSGQAGRVQLCRTIPKLTYSKRNKVCVIKTTERRFGFRMRHVSLLSPPRTPHSGRAPSRFDPADSRFRRYQLNLISVAFPPATIASH